MGLQPVLPARNRTPRSPSRWLPTYNHHRSHTTLGGQPPTSCVPQPHRTEHLDRPPRPGIKSQPNTTIILSRQLSQLYTISVVGPVTMADMSTPRRWRLWPLIGLVAVLVGAGSVLVAIAVNPGELAGDVVQTVTSVLALTGGLVLWLWTRSRQHLPTPVAAQAQASDALAAAALAQWERAASERRLRHPAPIPLRWQWSPLGVTSPASEALGGSGVVRFAPLPGMTPATSASLSGGHLGELLGVVGSLDSGRVIVTGGAGTGKSAAAILTMLDTLNYRKGLDETLRARVPVPVLLTALGWDPRRQQLSAWLADRLNTEYPFLRAEAYGRNTARNLVDSGQIALILDGFDEIPEELRSPALRALDQQATFRLMILTRTHELIDAVTDGHLHGSAALELLPVSANDAAEYLARCQVQPLPGSWQRLTEHLRTTPESAVSKALDNPLTLTLVRDMFPTLTELDELLHSNRFASRADVESYLLDRVLPVAYRPRLGEPSPPYDLKKAHDWLSFLAASMNNSNTRDLAWWHMRNWAPRPLRFAILAAPSAVGLAAAVGPLFAMAFGPMSGLAAGPLAGLANGAAIGLAVGLRKESTNADSDRAGSTSTITRVGTSRFMAAPGLTSGLASGITAGAAAAIMTGYDRGVAAGAVIGIAVALGLGLGAGATEQLLERHRNSGPRRPRPLRWKAIPSRGTLASGVAFGLLAGLTLGLAFGLTGSPTTGVAGGIAFGLFTTLLFGIANGLVQISGSSANPMDPVTCWHRDRQSALIEGISFGAAGGLAVGLAGGFLHGFKTGVLLGLIAGLGEGAAFTMAVSQSWLAAATFLINGNGGRLPRHGISFLEDARKRGILRTVGSVYQFRHARLQDRLARSTNGAQPALDPSLEGAA
jgi:hypothetical protein